MLVRYARGTMRVVALLPLLASCVRAFSAAAQQTRACINPRRHLLSCSVTTATPIRPAPPAASGSLRRSPSPTGLLKAATWPVRAVAARARGVQQFFDEELPFLRYLWPKDNLKLRLFLVLALGFMFAGKWINIQIPFILQRAVDGVGKASVPSATAGALFASDAFLRASALSLLVYGLSRALSVVCAEIKVCLFSHVSQNVLRKFANEIFTHLHSLDHDYHLTTPSGVISVAYARAVRGFQTMLFQIVFSVVPTFLELGMVSHVLFKRFGSTFSTITLATFSSYLAFTVWITQWRVAVRKELVDVDNTRNGFFIDSILNQEVIKLFTAEAREAKRFDGYLQRLEKLSIQSTYAIALLNLGQAFLFCAGLTASLVVASQRVIAGSMSIGDLVAVNSMLLQLSIPFNFIGYTYQELRQAFVDMGYMRRVLTKVEPVVKDEANTVSLDLLQPRSSTPSSVEFRNVSFTYQGAPGAPSPEGQEILRGLSFTVAPGTSTAIVGPSGSGKSTCLRLITRMVDCSQGQVLVDGVDNRHVSISSLRSRVGVVPQDNTLFDDTILHNIRYGNPHVSAELVRDAVDKCNLGPTLAKFPEGLLTSVGERGQRLSGGERQKVSIARALLKNPSLILCDEVTSAVDAFAEKEIIDTLRRASKRRTTITIAHRLSSVTHCDDIIVLKAGKIVQQGTHAQLLKDLKGTYAAMWTAQQGDGWLKEFDLCPVDCLLDGDGGGMTKMVRASDDTGAKPPYPGVLNANVLPSQLTAVWNDKAAVSLPDADGSDGSI